MADEDIKKETETTSTSEETSEEKDQKTEKTDDQKEPDFDYDKEHERVTGNDKGSKYSPREKAMNSFRGIVKELEKHGVDARGLFEGAKEGDQQDDKTPSQKALTVEDVERIVEQRAAKQRDELMEPVIDSKIAPLARSVGEAKLVKHYANIFLSQGQNLDDAVEIGWVVANRHRFKDTFAELSRGKGAEKGKTDGAGSGQRKQAPKTEPKGREAEFAKNRGLVWDDGEGKFISPARKTFLDKQRNPHAKK